MIPIQHVLRIVGILSLWFILHTAKLSKRNMGIWGCFLLLSAPVNAQSFLPFHLRWEPFEFGNKTALVESCNYDFYEYRNLPFRRSKLIEAGGMLFDSLGRATHETNAFRIPDQSDKPTWVYDQNGCPGYYIEELHSGERKYPLKTRKVIFHCTNGLLDTITASQVNIMVIQTRDSLGRLIKFEELHFSNQTHHEYEYDSLGRVCSVNGTVEGKIAYSDDGSQITQEYNYVQFGEHKYRVFRLNALGLPHIIEEGAIKRNGKFSRPSEVSIYEWKERPR